MHRGHLNIYSSTPAGKVLRGMLYALVLMLPLLAWIASWNC